MELGLKGKVALVTGTGSQVGFGKGIVLALAKEGCDIVATDIDLEGTKKTVAEVEALGRKAIAIKVDVTKGTEVDNMVKTALEKFGKIDILVNNAGASSGERPFVQSTEQDWDKDTNINYKGTLLCTHAVLSQMLKRKSGKIINMASVVALVPPGVGIATYAAAKSAVLIFSKSLAAELLTSGINVNVICPDIGDTGFHYASKSSKEFLARIKDMVAAERTVKPEDIGYTVAYLASDVSRKVTGQVIKLGLCDMA
jgi:3-oxoacyl-[acyl-carrier protein] reductase